MDAQPEIITIEDFERQQAARHTFLASGTAVVEFFLNHPDWQEEDDTITYSPPVSPEEARFYAPHLKALLDTNFDPAECIGINMRPAEMLRHSAALQKIGEVTLVEQV